MARKRRAHDKDPDEKGGKKPWIAAAIVAVLGTGGVGALWKSHIEEPTNKLKSLIESRAELVESLIQQGIDSKDHPLVKELDEKIDEGIDRLQLADGALDLPAEVARRIEERNEREASSPTLEPLPQATTEPAESMSLTFTSLGEIDLGSNRSGREEAHVESDEPSNVPDVIDEDWPPSPIFEAPVPEDPTSVRPPAPENAIPRAVPVLSQASYVDTHGIRHHVLTRDDDASPALLQIQGSFPESSDGARDE